ncbi:uncharacterized protein LOC131287188 [Anopheles ziemanni]|uniref:uncharacterized protein LOC131259137 n=1 Tax=Anopheles coustani TaxID=139045 RepID=UPI002658B1D6|nr:uncharacterized protein LOC131259137 [Anopheles coustani]XP_058172199.1 uncharacterized protein LOC131287188 [Anopheles ziemanni]
MEDEEQYEEQTFVECYDPVAIVLSSIHHDTENLTEQLRKCAVTYDQLSGLVEEDLRLMGMTNSKAIQDVLSEVSQLSNQRRLYDGVLRDEFVPEEYVQTVSTNCTAHLRSINVMMNLIQLKLFINFPNNLLLDDTIYSSEWCLKLCEKINAKLGDIERVVKEEDKRKTKKTFVRKVGFSIMLLSGAIVFTFCCKNSISKLMG